MKTSDIAEVHWRIKFQEGGGGSQKTYILGQGGFPKKGLG